MLIVGLFKPILDLSVMRFQWYHYTISFKSPLFHTTSYVQEKFDDKRVELYFIGVYVSE
jgi:hypothetical protein